MPTGDSLTVVARTGGRFVDFGPYVPSIDDAGRIAFFAVLADGRGGVFTGDEVAVRSAGLEEDPRFAEVTSHPDVTRGGGVSVYVSLAFGGHAVVCSRSGAHRILARTDPPLAAIGPLGPTMNERGAVAFRATATDGTGGVYRVSDDEVTCIAEAGQVYRAFHGLPVMGAHGAVVFRADRVDGTQVICVGDGSTSETVVSTGDKLSELGLFPCVTDAGHIGFVARDVRGAGGAYRSAAGVIDDIAHTRDGFESFRGVLLDECGGAVFYATPLGGSLGIYRGRDPVGDRIIGIGDTIEDHPVASFALNPVSINSSGQLAVRVALDGGPQVIARVDRA